MDDFFLELNIPSSLNFTSEGPQNCFTLTIPLDSVQFVELNFGEITLTIIMLDQADVLVLDETAIVTVLQAPRVEIGVSSAVNVSEGNPAVVCFAATSSTSDFNEQEFQLDLSLQVVDISTSKSFSFQEVYMS